MIHTFNIFNKRSKSMKFENNFSSCFSFLLFIYSCMFACVLVFFGDEEEREAKINTAKFPEAIQPNKVNFWCVDQNRKTMFGCHGQFNCWLTRDFEQKVSNSLSLLLFYLCSRWKGEIWTHSLQGYNCPRPQWSWEWPGGYSQVSGCNWLSTWLSPLCWHTLWYFGSWQHAR